MATKKLTKKQRTAINLNSISYSCGRSCEDAMRRIAEDNGIEMVWLDWYDMGHAWAFVPKDEYDEAVAMTKKSRIDSPIAMLVRRYFKKGIEAVHTC